MLYRKGCGYQFQPASPVQDKEHKIEHLESQIMEYPNISSIKGLIMEDFDDYFSRGPP